MGELMIQIFTKTGAVSKAQMARKIAPLSARQVLQERMSSDEKMATDKWYKGRINQEEARKNAAAYKKTYENTCPETLDSSTKNQMWKRAKELKDSFSVGMLSRDELHPVKSFVHDGVVKVVVDDDKLNTLNSVKREVAWQNKNENNIKEYKNIMRHLCPDNSGATDIEHFRPRRRAR